MYWNHPVYGAALPPSIASMTGALEETRIAWKRFPEVLGSKFELSMNNFASSKQPPEIQSLAPKAEAAWNVLYGRYASRVSPGELDHLFARFAFGLTSPLFGEGEPSVHYDICRLLIGLKLPQERVHAALHTVPESTEPWVEDVYESVELQGTKMGLALAGQKHNRVDQLDAEADAAHRELSSGAKEKVNHDKVH